MTTTVDKAIVADKLDPAAKLATAEASPSADKVPAPDKRRALGRGLESLLPGGLRATVAPLPPTTAPQGSTPPGASLATPASASGPYIAPRPADGSAVVQLPVDHIDPNPYQTRSRIPQEELQELADSIQASGVIQPIVVRPGKDGRYVLITGDRRTRASRLAGKERIPAIVRHVSDQQAAEMTIVENLQRQDLNCWDQAQAFARLSHDFGLTQEQIGKRTGCDRSSVSNYMRLLKLPAEVQTMLKDGELDFSQARVLLTLQNPDQVFKAARQAVEKHLSVIQLEALVARTNFPAEAHAQPGVSQPVDPNVKAAQRELEAILGVRVSIRDRRGKGKIVIEYTSLDDFDRVLEMLKGKNH
jgi:ParB family chromosome partitioning protein